MFREMFRQGVAPEDCRMEKGNCQDLLIDPYSPRVMDASLPAPVVIALVRVVVDSTA